MPSWCSDQALAHIEQERAGAMGILLPHIWQETSAYPSSQGDTKDEAGEETAHQDNSGEV